MKEAESALKTVENSSINAKAAARAVESESLNQVASKPALGEKGKLHANFQSLMQV